MKAIIFDLDGVIIDSAADIAAAVQYTLNRFDKPILTMDEIISYVGYGPEVLIRRSFKECSEELIQQAIPFYRQYYWEHALVDTRLYPGVKETLEFIACRMVGKKIALVTNKPEPVTKSILLGLGVQKYFAVVVGPESVEKIKPDPEGINLVLRQFGLESNQAIMVGDTYIDIRAGKAAGVVTCAVSYGLGNQEDLFASQPDITIDHIAELLDYIE